MNTIIVICEGQAEQEFCNSVLYPHFKNLDVNILSPVISISNGGIVKWEVLKKEVIEYLKNNNKKTYITTFIDFYGLTGKGYPKHRIVDNVNLRRLVVCEIEEAMQDEIEDRYKYRFIPYIQLHEFEALIFTDISILKDWYNQKEILDFDYLEQTIKLQPDTELINDSPQTAPSKRLIKAIPKYDKVTFGNILLMEIGLKKLRENNMSFNIWINKLEDIQWN